jgi:hypothetical protein
MKNRIITTLLLISWHQYALACETCKKQQPKITQGFTHGVGPGSNWDWVIVSIVVVITIATLLFSLKYLIKPGEKNSDHIKQTILSL